MTPTLMGRWHSRLFLFSTVGVIISILLGLTENFDMLGLFTGLGVVLIVGLLLDVAYQGLIKSRWDQDWPPVYVFLAGVAEWLISLFIVTRFDIPWLASCRIPGGIFTIHYVLVWLAVFSMLFGGMRVVFLRWRFRGGEVATGVGVAILLVWSIALIGGGIFLLSQGAGICVPPIVS